MGGVPATDRRARPADHFPREVVFSLDRLDRRTVALGPQPRAARMKVMIAISAMGTPWITRGASAPTPP